MKDFQMQAIVGIQETTLKMAFQICREMEKEVRETAWTGVGKGGSRPSIVETVIATRCRHKHIAWCVLTGTN
jgi:deoxyhypusine synthase